MAKPDSINSAAADWLIRLNEPGASEQLRAEFDSWQRQDPRHAAAALIELAFMCDTRDNVSVLVVSLH